MQILKSLLESFRKVGRRILPHWAVNSYHFFAAFLAVVWYRYPSRKLTVIGVTGTDGKTTTCYFINSILRNAGKKSGMVSSIVSSVGSKEYETGLHITTPSSFKLQRFLRQMVMEGCEYAVLEVTSHALDQYRVFGCNFKIGIVTNVTHEHLDYHKNFERYLCTKAKLIRKSTVAILNKDEQRTYGFLSREVKNEKFNFGVYEEADVKAVNTKLNFRSTYFSYVDKFSPIGAQLSFLKEINLNLPGVCNIYNALAAIAATKILGISEEQIKKGLEAVKRVPGRMEVIAEKPFGVVIDFAHTPNALEQVLKLSSKLKAQSFDNAQDDPERSRMGQNSKLISVFGSAGLRDKTKRPTMGRIAQNIADLVVLTAEDPRTEEVNDIIEDIAKGCRQAGGIEEKTYYKIPDRKKAIEFAIRELARSGDLILITGKGHEKSMCLGEKEYPWDEFKIVKRALKSY